MAGVSNNGTTEQRCVRLRSMIHRYNKYNKYIFFVFDNFTRTLILPNECFELVLFYFWIVSIVIIFITRYTCNRNAQIQNETNKKWQNTTTTKRDNPCTHRYTLTRALTRNHFLIPMIYCCCCFIWGIIISFSNITTMNYRTLLHAIARVGNVFTLHKYRSEFRSIEQKYKPRRMK